jgi:photosystem II stability/assembly factor-like uncharacterized protein
MAAQIGRPRRIVRVNLGCVYFYDDQIGWAVGFKDVILKTTDGGTNWKLLYSEDDK